MNEMRKLIETIETLSEATDEEWDIAINNLIIAGDQKFGQDSTASAKEENVWFWVRNELHNIIDFRPQYTTSMVETVSPMYADLTLEQDVEQLYDRFDRVKDKMSDEDGDRWDEIADRLDWAMHYGDDQAAEAYASQLDDILDRCEPQTDDFVEEEISLNEDYDDKAEQLQYVQEEMLDLLDQAEHIMSGTSDEAAANAYWIPHIKTALTNSHEYLGGSMHTMEDSINALMAEGGPDDDEEEEETGEGPEYDDEGFRRD